MSFNILALVLLAALLDALQHGLIKSGADPFARSLAVAVAGGAIAAPLLVLTGLPAAAALPWLAASVVIGTLYWIALGWAYQTGALAFVFPLSRGAGVMLTAIGAHVLVGERLDAAAALLLGAILVGLALVTFSVRPAKGLGLSGLIPSACLAVIISTFTLIDALGVRAAGAAMPYCLVLYVGNACGIGAFALIRHRARLMRLPPAVLPGITLSAILSLTAYGLILYGFRHAPVALVAAVAETSIVFATLLGLLWLREPARMSHSLGVAVIAAGVVILRLGV